MTTPRSNAATGATSSDGTGLRRVATGALVGTALEWYDSFVYGTAAALAERRPVDVLGLAVPFLASFLLIAVSLTCGRRSPGPAPSASLGWSTSAAPVSDGSARVLTAVSISAAAIGADYRW